MTHRLTLPLFAAVTLPLAARDAPSPTPSADAAVAAPAHPADSPLTPDFQPLFVADDLSDGVVRGGTATYARDGEGNIVGHPTQLGGLNTFLCSKDDYHNFVLRYSFHVDPSLNAGVQIRSSVLRREDERDLVGGPQIEIDTDPVRNRMWTAGIYGENVAPWLVPAEAAPEEVKDAFTAQGREITKVDGWNEVVVVAVGERITTWLNGHARADLADSPTETGFVGLQVHNVHDEAALEKEVRWRGVELWILPEDADYDQVRAAIEAGLTPAETAAGEG